MVKTVVIGNGAWGSRLARITDAMDEYKVIGCIDKDHYRRVNLADELGCWSSEDIDERIGEADAVIIATPPDSGRAHQIHECISLGVKKIRIEKPVAIDLDEIDEIEKLGSYLTVGQTTIFQDVIPTIKKFVDTIEIKNIKTGRLSQVGTEHQSSPILDLAPHDIAILMLLTSTPECLITEFQWQFEEVSKNRLQMSSGKMNVDMVFRWDAKDKIRFLEVEGYGGEFLLYDEITGILVTSRDSPSQQTKQFKVGNAVQNELKAWLTDSGVSAAFGCHVARLVSQANFL